APGGPNVHQRDVAAVVLAERDRRAGGQCHRGEIGGLGADADRGVGTRREAEQQDHRASHHVLLPAASSRARTAAAGSLVPNTAVPATKVSAPAARASPMVAVVMPPSTSSVALEP